MKQNIYTDNTTLIVKETDIFQAQKKVLNLHLKGVKITTLHRFIQSYDSTLKTNWTVKYEIYQRFKEIIDELHYFKSSALSSTFIQECLSFLNNMHLYHITPDDLPTSSDTYKELKKILTSIYDIKTEASYHTMLLSQIHDLNDVYIDIKHPSFHEKFLIDALINKGAKTIQSIPQCPTYEYYHANNMRCEIESIAQMIISNEMNVSDIMIAYCDQKYASLIASVFDRYHLPIHMQAKKPSSISFKCVALLEFAFNPSFNTFHTCLTQGCFNHVDRLIEAQKIYPYNYNEAYPNIDAITLKSEIFSKHEINQLIQLIHEANIQKEAIYSDCDRLVHAKDSQEILICIDEILRKNMRNTKEDTTAILQIQSLFRDALPYLNTNEDFNLLKEEIKSMKLTNTLKRWDAIHVIPYSQINDLSKITFICGTTQSSFNEFSPLQGIFDETYVENIHRFPSLMERYNYAHSILMNKCKNGNQVIFTYPQSDYLGKNFEAALDVDNLLAFKSTLMPLIQSYKNSEKIQMLTHKEAINLYTKNNSIRGSISSLEKYVGCPYAYFLKYGCRIAEPIESGFNVQKIGTLNHSVLEELVNNHSKNYTKDTFDEMVQIIDLNINDMKQVFPHLKFDFIRNRLIENMQLNLFILNDMENASSMTPTYCEYKWNRDIQIDNITLSLIGFVDRIDTAPTTFRVIDYKSSQKKLEKDKVFSGQQLQLCTYLMQIKDELNLRPLGGFYYSFMNSKFELPYQKISRKDKVVEEISKAAIEKEILKRSRLQGWIFDDNVEIMDDTATHVQGISNTKSKGIHARNVYNLDEVSDCIVEMMKIIVTNILSGNIQCEPNEAACMFCKYRPICRFNGSYTEKKQLVEFPSCMRKENENE